MKNFKTYQLAVDVYKQSKKLRLPYALKDQLQRVASSIALNLAEGSAKPMGKDRLKFYCTAFGSLREVQALAQLEPEVFQSLNDALDPLGAMLYRLCY